MNRLDNKVAIVSGGARGLGGAAVKALAAEGANVVVADLLADEGQALVDDIVRAGGTACFAELDVRDRQAWDRVVSDCIEAYGRVDILLNSAGITLPKTIEEATIDEFKQVMDINLYGTFHGIQAVIPTMKNQASGSIINVASNSTEMIVPTTTYYATSKAAVANLTKTAAVHLGSSGCGIRVNSIHPGPHETPMITAPHVAQMPHIQRMKQTIPLGRFGRPEEFGQLVVFLASDESSYSTASEFFIDGGLSRVSDSFRKDES